MGRKLPGERSGPDVDWAQLPEPEAAGLGPRGALVVVGRQKGLVVRHVLSASFLGSLSARRGIHVCPA